MWKPPPKPKGPPRERYQRPPGAAPMTMQEAQRFVGRMRGLLKPDGHDIFYLTNYCSRVLRVQVGHFRDLDLQDAYTVARQATKEYPMNDSPPSQDTLQPTPHPKSSGLSGVPLEQVELLQDELRSALAELDECGPQAPGLEDRVAGYRTQLLNLGVSREAQP